jgi:hypothetical protein
MVHLIAFIRVLEPVRQRKNVFNRKKIFFFQVFDLRFFTQIFILQQCLDPNPNPYPNPNFFSDSDSDPSKTFGFGYTTLVYLGQTRAQHVVSYSVYEG